PPAEGLLEPVGGLPPAFAAPVAAALFGPPMGAPAVGSPARAPLEPFNAVPIAPTVVPLAALRPLVALPEPAGTPSVAPLSTGVSGVTSARSGERGQAKNATATPAATSAAAPEIHGQST